MRLLLFCLVLFLLCISGQGQIVDKPKSSQIADALTTSKRLKNVRQYPNGVCRAEYFSEDQKTHAKRHIIIYYSGAKELNHFPDAPFLRIWVEGQGVDDLYQVEDVGLKDIVSYGQEKGKEFNNASIHGALHGDEYKSYFQNKYDALLAEIIEYLKPSQPRR